MNVDYSTVIKRIYKPAKIIFANKTLPTNPPPPPPKKKKKAKERKNIRNSSLCKTLLNTT